MSKLSFKDWQVQLYDDPDFLAECRRLETGYQIARLRLLRGMTQAELADGLGICEALIASFENGSSMPNLPFLKRIAEKLDAQVEIKIRPRTAHP